MVDLFELIDGLDLVSDINEQENQHFLIAVNPFADFDFVVLQHLLIAQDLALDIANHDVSIAISILLLGGALGLDKNLVSIFHEAHVFLRFLVFGKNLDLEK